MTRHHDHSLLVSFLSFIFGFASWVAMTGIWVELPLLVLRLPEGPSLGSFLSLALQSANIGCLFYALAYKLRPTRKTEDVAIHLQMALGVLSALLLIFCWDLTAEIEGQPRSIALLVLSFAMSIVDCISSISFLPYMARFKSVYMTPYLAGEGMGGLIPSLVAVAQGIGASGCERVNVTHGNQTSTEFHSQVPKPRFSESVFFTILFLIFLLSWVAFTLLCYLDAAKKEQVQQKAHNQNGLDKTETEIPRSKEEDKNGKQDTSSELFCINGYHPMDKILKEGCVTEFTFESPDQSKKTWLYLIFLQGWSSLTTFGIFPAIQPYSLIPYSYEAFHWAVTLCGIAYPLACMFVAVVEIRRPRALGVMTLLATIFGVLIFLTALQSPEPPLFGTTLGAVLVVFLWVSFTSLFSYIKTMVTVVLLDTGGHNAMLWVGLVTQVGGVVGALLMFLLINLPRGFFKNPDECEL